MKKWLLLVLSAIIVFSLAACNSTSSESNSDSGAGKDEKITLRMAWWGSDPRHDYTLEIIELYEKQHPNVKIQPEYASWDDYWKKMAPQATANKLPDIIQMDLSYITQYANNNQLADLKPFFGKEINTEDLSQDFLDGGKIGDKYYGLNGGVNALSYQYDPALLKKLA